MRIARISTPTGPRAVVSDAADWVVVVDAFAPHLDLTGERHPQAGATLLAPVEPRVVLGMLHNTGPDERELAPQAFLKSARTVVGPGEPIAVDLRHGDHVGECELALVVGRRCRGVTVDQAPAYVLGWTVGNDVTVPAQGAVDVTRTQAKNGDGFTPLGPWIETDLDALDAALVARVDGVQVAQSTTARLAWNPFEALSHLSAYLTLGPGDVILTGAPFTSFPIRPGVRATCEVAGIGPLTNPVTSLKETTP